MIRFAFALAFVGSAAALAQPAPAKTAEEHFEASKKLYNIDKFDEAIAELKQAYMLSPDPVYLFNIAQALRKKGDCVGAIDYYRKYLRDSPSAPNKAKVETWIGELEACAKTQPKVEPNVSVIDTKPVDTRPVDTRPVDTKPVDTRPVDTKPIDTRPVDTRPVVPIDQDSSDPKRTMRIFGLGIAGFGAGALVFGTVFAFNARSISNDVQTDCNDMNGCNWDLRSQDDERGRSRATLSRIALGVGGAALIGGGVLYMLNRPSKESRLAIVPAGDGAMVTFGGRY